MGQQQQKILSKPITEKTKENETPIYRNRNFTENLAEKPLQDINTLQDLVLRSLKLFSDKQFLFQRRAELNNKYQGRTYKEVLDISRQIGSGLQNLQLIHETIEYKHYKIKPVGIYSKNREEWLMVDIACMLYGYTNIPLYDTLGKESLNHCIYNSGITNCFCQSSSIDNLLQQDDLGPLKTLIAFDQVTQEQQKKANSKGIKLIQFQTIIQNGKEQILDLPQIDPENIFTFSYTSGTSGFPKGTMLTHKNFIAFLAAQELGQIIQFYSTDVHLSYLPLPHIFDRVVSISILFYGAKIYYYNGDVLKLKEDLQEAQPTIFCSVPRLYNKFFSLIKDNLQKETGLKKMFIDHALNSKLGTLKRQPQYTHCLYDQLVFNKIKQIFGGRVRILITGSAPISEEVQQFFKAAMCCPFLEAYGQTECMGGEFVQEPDDISLGHVGGVVPSCEFKLVDVPEMQYYSTKKDENGNPTPQGEIWVRGPQVFEGYYKMEDKTKETKTEDGWLMSGDVGMILPNGGLKIIDRKKNIFKLSQGEYVAPEKIEQIYIKTPGVQEAFVYGESQYSYCIGIIVPDKNYIEQIGKDLGLEGSFEQLCQNQQIKQKILEQLTNQGKKDGLYGFEQVKKIYLEPKSFGEHDCHSNTMKLQRFQAKKVFQEQLQSMYNEQ